MKALIAAFRFLTTFPVPGGKGIEEKDIAHSLPFFPVVGLFIGGTAALGDFVFSLLLPPGVAAVLTVLLLVLITGGLHLDGLADTADGIFSVRNRERMLEIMRDSHIGTMGVLALLFVLALKIAALAPLPHDRRLGILILMPLAGRAAMLLMLTALPYARKDGGLASLFIRHRSWGHPVFAMIFTIVTGLILGGGGWLPSPGAGLLTALGGIVAATLTVALIYRRLGGFTGDTVGAAAEIAETAAALTGLALCLP
ncbi:MAG: adenosylcobinamide-GDP ribazoletransferase [Pseudomonadota bacterium]|nr:adenosylcobinamide-GDP ribazoletransferase [Pseudomonadota bacterium]